jgi:pimeloyl-ACP methyl ester carboxylesterase
LKKLNWIRFVAGTVMAVLIFSSCEDIFDRDTDNTENEYLASMELVKTISQTEVGSRFAYLKTLYPEAQAINDKATSGVKVYKITYHTKFQDSMVIASGLVCLPVGSGEYPLLSFQNGTNTLHSDAPTVNPERQMYRFLEAVSSTGYVIVLADYIGFGSTEELFHPYLDKESTTQCLIDMLRATKELAEPHNLDIALSNDLYITGYSMGGWATLCLQRALETEFASEFNLKASACAAGPYDLEFISTSIMEQETYPMPYFLGYILHAFTSLGQITNPLSDILREPYASRIPSLFDGNKDGDQINSQLTTTVADLFTQVYQEGYRTDPQFAPVRQTLLRNSVEPWNIKTPLMFLHGMEDHFVSPQGSDKMYSDLLTAGSDENKIQRVFFPGFNHTEGIIPCGIAAITWFLEIKNGI